MDNLIVTGIYTCIREKARSKCLSREPHLCVLFENKTRLKFDFVKIYDVILFTLMFIHIYLLVLISFFWYCN